jgi:hypothetical protein
VDIRDRIVELRRVPGRELVANPLNYRTHPAAQRSALAGVLEQVGIAAALIARETPEGLLLIDGHLRAEDYGDQLWPVLVLDVTEEEGNLLLATLDPLAALAGQNDERLAELLTGLGDEASGVASLLREAEEAAGQAPGAADFLEPPAGAYQEQYGVIVVCDGEEEQERIFRDLTERGLTCRVVVT